MGEAKKRVEAYQRAIAAAHATIYDHHNPVTVKTAFEAAQKTDIKRPQAACRAGTSR
ncbi:MAG: hypothetical protein E7K72_24780 [Roseomonas mucosa]|nr:hypothetical protein [Roseomonas mucosa]